MPEIEVPVRDRAIAQFLRTLSSAALDLAAALEGEGLGPPTPGESDRWLSVDKVGLGSLQLQIAHAPGMATDEGVSPRQITQHLSRGDEPNIRTALAALQKRNVAEMVPGATPQRWRLKAVYRRDPKLKDGQTQVPGDPSSLHAPGSIYTPFKSSLLKSLSMTDGHYWTTQFEAAFGFTLPAIVTRAGTVPVDDNLRAELRRRCFFVVSTRTYDYDGSLNRKEANANRTRS